jgi:hypothetical protein
MKKEEFIKIIKNHLDLEFYDDKKHENNIGEWFSFSNYGTNIYYVSIFKRYVKDNKIEFECIPTEHIFITILDDNNDKLIQPIRFIDYRDEKLKELLK